MIRRILFFLIASTTLVFAEKPHTVRILLKKLSEDALIEVKGRHILYNPKTDEWIATKRKKKRARMTTVEKGLYWGEILPNIFEIRIVADEPGASILVDGIQYKGKIEVFSIGGTINIVNEIECEDYLKSILSSQIDQKYSKEALDAIVITQRTNLYYMIQKDSYASWQMEAQQVGYQGNTFGKFASMVEDAVDRTRDMILHYKKKPFATSWSPNNAGRSVAYPAVFRKNAVTPRGVDNLPSLHKRDKSRWKAQMPLKTLCEAAGLQDIREIELFRAKNSSKVYAVRLIGPNGNRDVDFFSFQKVVGEILQSNDFNALVRGKKVCFFGYGKGIGVGLCAESADILSRREESTDKILTYHFPGSSLINIRHETGKW